MSCQRGPIHHPSKPAFNYSGLPLGAGWLSGPDRDVPNHYFSTPTIAAHRSESSTEIHLATYIRIYLRPQDGLTLLCFPMPLKHTTVSHDNFSFSFFWLSFICKEKLLVRFRQAAVHVTILPHLNQFSDFQEKLYKHYITQSTKFLVSYNQ